MTTKQKEQTELLNVGNKIIEQSSMKITDETLLDKIAKKDFNPNDFIKISTNRTKWNHDFLIKSFPTKKTKQQRRKAGRNVFKPIIVEIADLYKATKKVNTNTLYNLHMLQMKFFTDRSCLIYATSEDKADLKKQIEQVLILLSDFRTANKF